MNMRTLPAAVLWIALFECFTSSANSQSGGGGNGLVTSCDLVIIKPDGTEMTESEEDNAGEFVAVNANDDDGDAFSGSTPKFDKDDDYVTGEKDLVQIKIHAYPVAQPATAKFKLYFDTTHFAVWKNKEKGTTAKVASGITEFDPAVETPLYVEGLVQHTGQSSSSSVFIELKLTDGATIKSSDTIKMTVAEPIFVMYADWSNTTELDNYIAKRKRDNRPGIPVVVSKADGKRAYSISKFRTSRGVRLAFDLTGAYIVVEGHSHYGAGYAFDTDTGAEPATITDLLNIGESYAAINENSDGIKDTLPGFHVEESEIPNDPTTTEPKDAWRYSVDVLPNLKAYRWANSQPQGIPVSHISFKAATAVSVRYHYNANNPNEPLPLYLVVNVTTETVSHKWQKLFLNTCESGKHYLAKNNFGTVFFTRADVGNRDVTTAFVGAVVEQYTDVKIIKLLNTQPEKDAQGKTITNAYDKTTF